MCECFSKQSIPSALQSTINETCPVPTGAKAKKKPDILSDRDECGHSKGVTKQTNQNLKRNGHTSFERSLPQNVKEAIEKAIQAMDPPIEVYKNVVKLIADFTGAFKRKPCSWRLSHCD